MQTKKIEAEEIEGLKIASLPTRPTAAAAFGGKGYTASEMKAAFDKLPLLIIERLNALIEELGAEGEDNLVLATRTGLSAEHTLFDLIQDMKSGRMAHYLIVNGLSLMDRILMLEGEISELWRVVNE